MTPAPRFGRRRAAPLAAAALVAVAAAGALAAEPESVPAPRYFPRLWLPEGAATAPSRAGSPPAPAAAAGGAAAPSTVAEFPAAAAATLSPADLASARTAWSYFRRNRRAATGMVDGVQGYSYVTAWDLGSTLGGIVAAERLGVIDAAELDEWLGALLATLARLTLYRNELPNREYDSRDARMVDLGNRPSSRGSGWSALDIGRLLVWLRLVEQWYPRHAGAVQAVVARWDFGRLATGGEMHGVLVRGAGEDLRQEGRLGYEQYAAAGFALWGVELPQAFAREATVAVEVEGIGLRRDTRNLAFLTSDPFYLAAIELGGIETEFEALTEAVYRAQRRRAERTGVLTAVGEDSIDVPPWFVYSTLWIDGEPWRAVAHDGRPATEHRTLSTKAAFGWHALFPDAYSVRLLAAVQDTLAAEGGYRAGLYESDGRPNRSLNVNTNAVVLESLLYVQRGRRPFLRWRR